MLSASIIATLLMAGRPVALVGYGVGALQWAADSRARPLVEGRAVTGPSNSEERAQGLTGILPFSLEDELIRLGGHYRKSADGVSHVVRDGSLITGQNTASSVDAARVFLGALR
jgi:putative intracellular protease/amidase